MSEPRLRRAEITREQTHVDRVYARLGELRDAAEEMRSKGYEIGKGARSEAEIEQASMLFERDMMVSHANQTLQTLDAEYEGLVFGRLDYAPGDDTGHDRGHETDADRDHETEDPAGGSAEPVYVGRLGIRDEQFENLVTDWRAPAAAAFYQATPQEPRGVLRRRVIRCSGDRVLDVDDDVLLARSLPDELPVVGEGALMAALGRARGEHMRDIVSTIQAEQDKVIRAPWHGVTEITGGPGTGKTAVALHRAAYLLYQHRKRMGPGVLVVGPSALFTDYISRVLPAMGETTAELRSLGEVLDGLELDRQDRSDVAAIKGSLRMQTILRRAIREVPPEAPDELRIVYQGEVLKLQHSELSKLRKKLHRQVGQPNHRRVRVAEALLAALADKAEEQAQADGREFDRDELIARLGERIDFHRFVVRWWPVLYPAQILGWLRDERRLARVAGKLLDEGEVRTLAAALPTAAEAGSVADVALLDELRVLLGTPPKRRSTTAESAENQPEEDEEQAAPGTKRPRHYDEYAHVVVDEAQDLSPMQWRMVGRRGRYASWTIVGDPLQSSWPAPEESERARDEAFGKQLAHRRFTLRTNYRNSAEIFEFAADVITGQGSAEQLPNAVRRTGEPPRVRSIDGVDAERALQSEVKELLDASAGTVGVIAAMDRMEQVERWLAGQADDRLKIVGSLHCKGLEYDAVVVLEPTELISESLTGRRVLYVALTRATQHLSVLTSEEDWLG